MNADTLLQHFERISEAPDAVPRLRRFVLDLAVRGKLVEQNPEDEPSRGLELVELSSDEAPFEIPSSWSWTLLKHLGQVKGGGTPSKGNARFWGGEIPWVPPKEMKRDYIDRAALYVTDEALAESSAKLIEAGSLLFVVRGMILVHSFPVALTTVPVVVNQDMKAIELSVPEMKEFVLRAMKGMRDHVLVKVKRSSHGTCRLEAAAYLNLPFPLPPLPEQHRIVAKVDELMALCDELETAETTRENRRDRLVAATLHRLNNPDTDSEATFKQTAAFYLNHLPRLTTKPEHIHQLRQTILNLAVRGKLVPQDPEDEPAGELIQRIDVERRVSENANKIKKRKKFPELVSEQVPFELPDSWLWVRLANVADCRLGKMLDKAKNRGTLRPYFRNVNVRWFDFDLSDLKEMRLEDSELDELSLRAGDVLVCEGGEPGRAAVWDERAPDIYFQKALHRVRLLGGIVPAFFVLTLAQAAQSGHLEQFFTGVTIKHLTGKGLARFAVPLPPLPEQHRIVAKVDELTALCDGLESQQTMSATIRAQVLNGVLQKALDNAERRRSLTSLP